MYVERVKRWQWLLLSVLVGLALWYARRPDASDLARYGEGLNDPAAFENALFGAVDGVPRVQGLTVHRQAIDDGAGSRRTAYVVSGDYCDGRPDPIDGTFRWRPRFFLAPVPYRARMNLYNLGGTDDEAAEAVRRYERMESPTVLDFLRLLETAKVVSYTHAWWRTYPAATWVGGSVLLVGVVWPTVINLLAYGRLTRPREEKGVDLSKVRSTATPAPPGTSGPDIEHLHQLEAELEANLSGAAGPEPDPQPAATPRPAPALSTAPLEPVAAPAHDDTVFGAHADDFYPTERHADHHHPPGPAGAGPAPPRV